MPSQLELLKAKLPKLEAEFGPANPYVQGLKAQIASYEKPPAENPVEMYSVGMRGAPPPASSPSQAFSEEAGRLYEQIASSLEYGMALLEKAQPPSSASTTPSPSETP